MRNNIMGIYRITNILDGKIYMGSAHDISVRWNTHKRELKINNHDNKYLQCAWNKDGEDNFKFEVMQEVKHEYLLLDIEQEWLDKTQCYNPEIGYNLSCVTRGSTVKYNILRQDIIDNIIKEESLLYYEENTNINLYDKDNQILPMIDNLDGLIRRIYMLYSNEIEFNNKVNLSNCIIYTKLINFDLCNIIKSKVNINSILDKYNIEMIRIEDYGNRSETLNIYKNTFVYFKIDDGKLVLQNYYRKDEIYLK